jgi:hypothetical protein
VLLSGVPEDEAHLYLAAYQLAPWTVAFAGRERPLPGSVVAVYGRQPDDSEHALAILPEGFLMPGLSP